MTSMPVVTVGLAALCLALAGCTPPRSDTAETPEADAVPQAAPTPTVGVITTDQANRIRAAGRVEAEFVACGILTPEALARVAPGKRRILAPGVDPVAHDVLYDVAFSQATQAYNAASAAQKAQTCQRARATAAEIAGMRAGEAAAPAAPPQTSLEEAQAALDRIERNRDQRNP